MMTARGDRCPARNTRSTAGFAYRAFAPDPGRPWAHPTRPARGLGGGNETLLRRGIRSTLCSPDNPKICGVDDAKIIGDVIAERVPFLSRVYAQEAQDRVGEVADGLVLSVVGDGFYSSPSIVVR
jgi:hypothetical protein